MNIGGLVGALLPVFFVLALGYVAGKRNTFDAGQAAGLSKLALGFALPAAIGVKAARPEAEVWAIVGDGGFQMTMAELATMVQEKLKVNIAIINNGYLGMVRQWQEFFYDRNYEATPLLSPNFVKLADAFGIRAIAVTQRSQVVPTVEMAHKHKGPVLIDFQVEQEDSVYPMVAAGAALHEMIRRPNPIVETATDA